MGRSFLRGPPFRTVLPCAGTSGQCHLDICFKHSSSSVLFSSSFPALCININGHEEVRYVILNDMEHVLGFEKMDASWIRNYFKGDKKTIPLELSKHLTWAQPPPCSVLVFSGEICGRLM